MKRIKIRLRWTTALAVLALTSPARAQTDLFGQAPLSQLGHLDAVAEGELRRLEERRCVGLRCLARQFREVSGAEEKLAWARDTLSHLRGSRSLHALPEVEVLARVAQGLAAPVVMGPRVVGEQLHAGGERHPIDIVERVELVHALLDGIGSISEERELASNQRPTYQRVLAAVIRAMQTHVEAPGVYTLGAFTLQALAAAQGTDMPRAALEFLREHVIEQTRVVSAATYFHEGFRKLVSLPEARSGHPFSFGAEARRRREAADRARLVGLPGAGEWAETPVSEAERQRFVGALEEGYTTRRGSGTWAAGVFVEATRIESRTEGLPSRMQALTCMVEVQLDMFGHSRLAGPLLRVMRSLGPQPARETLRRRTRVARR